jgi:hypothetical protein
LDAGWAAHGGALDWLVVVASVQHEFCHPPTMPDGSTGLMCECAPGYHPASHAVPLAASDIGALRRLSEGIQWRPIGAELRFRGGDYGTGNI